ncbi:hypothetical protein CONLIGDRAFT_681473 [Coniochaeta ligniaria NRRL 30616]|uniref:Uncharacterized protein n=1 Tax=Coniochaeta ligniaria NRRL 30616 TaxID=1408157 RepID=A0A1J7ILQ4_9PEZI|nr:hypothetical protein CONLIGDRAFT_681473 [Coniochaeta ligniaria NRRL 30616]
MSRSSSGILSPPQKMRSRTQSISSDRPSTIGHNLMSPPLSVSPEAAFIAASAASQIVTNDHDSHADTWYDQHGIEPSGETALVSPSALRLINSFLDQLLFNFLSVARSTTLSSLRPAVSEVLKPKLAKDAINQADEELREYLGGGDDDEPSSGQDPQATRDWDLELIWKRTRLRCMVYSSLGDMEEEDEDYYMEQDHLEPGLDDQLSEAVPAAVAIFLTSILEFMGEAALVVAGQAAYHRMRVKNEKELKEGARSPSDAADRIVVDELDMERVALDRTLGRLWRAWKKKIRSPGPLQDNGLGRPLTRDSMRGISGQHMRQSSFTLSNESGVPPTVPEPEPEAELEAEKNMSRRETSSEEPSEEYLLAAAIPLPMTDNDIDEIEVPGLASYVDEDEDDTRLAAAETKTRPKSLMILPHALPADLRTPTSESYTPVVTTRKRSNSVPIPAATPYESPLKRPSEKDITTELAEDAETPKEADVTEKSLGGVSHEETPDPDQRSDVASPSSTAESLGPDVTGSYHKRNLSAESAVISSAAAVELTAVAGLTADLHLEGEELGNGEDDVEEIEEEPQVLTSSRVSISGRSASPATSEHRRPSPINPNLPVRSLSVHSLRLIDVTSPRSPSTRSRGSSVDATELIRSANLSRTNSASTTPLIEEYRTALEPAPGVRASNMFATESISEAEELGVDDAPPMTPADVREDNSVTPVAKPRSPSRYEQRESDLTTSLPIFGSSVRHQSPPSSPARQTPAATKVTILPATSSPGTFFIDESKPEVPQKSPVKGRGYPPVQIPSVPERSPGRQANETAKPPAIPAATIGNVSVESRARSTSEARQLHTSGSSTSSGNNRLKAVRTSEESPVAKKVDMARNFEDLIQSDETIQYTLTPESARDDPMNSVPIVQVRSGKSEDTHKGGERSRSSSVNQQNGLKRSTSVTRPPGINGLNSHPVLSDTLSTASRGNGPIPRSVPPKASKTRANGPQARDARLPRESIADFADFIRSTGPPGEPANSGMANGGNAFTRAAGPSAVRTVSGSVPVSTASIHSSRASTSTNPNRPRYQPREAAVDYKDDNSDLIDFIRRGPPTAVDNPRIPRTVAPFRTTMDSDQMSGAVGGRAVDAQIRDMNDVRSSQASTNITDYSMPSVQSSINSQTGLLRGKAVPGQSQITSFSRYGGLDTNEDMPIPKRKTRRVRDPYAIDISDEDEDPDEEEEDRERTPKADRRVIKKQPQEESLADFLRNYAPPPEPPAPVKPFSIADQMANRPKKKASAPSLMARFTRRDSSANTPPASPKVTVPPSRPDYSRSVASRAGSVSISRHIPIQLNMPPGVDKYNPAGHGGPTTSSTSSRPTVSFNNSTGRVPMKRYEPREAVSVPARSATSDLADFLRNSGPPPGSVVQDPYPSAQSEQKSGFFARRKKAGFA